MGKGGWQGGRRPPEPVGRAALHRDIPEVGQGDANSQGEALHRLASACTRVRNVLPSGKHWTTLTGCLHHVCK